MTPTQSLQPVQGDTRAACINLPMRAECKHRNWYLKSAAVFSHETERLVAKEREAMAAKSAWWGTPAVKAIAHEMAVAASTPRLSPLRILIETRADCVDGRAWIDLQSRHESALAELHTLRRENSELERENSRLRRKVEAHERGGRR